MWNKYSQPLLFEAFSLSKKIEEIRGEGNNLIPIFMYVYMRAAAENSKLVVIISYRSRQCFFDKDEEEEYLRTYQPTYLPIYLSTVP